MKNINQESRLLRMRQHYRNDRQSLSGDGLMIQHVYTEQRVLSWWDDVGFILNGRWVMVWWIHPRMKYLDAIRDAANVEAGESPPSIDDMFDEQKCTKQYKRLGRSRKKIVSYTASPHADDTRAYYDRLFAMEDRLSKEGIDHVARPSMTIQRYDWCIGVDLCIPCEILSETDAIALAGSVRKVLKNGRTLAALSDLFPEDYQYGQEQWLIEADARQRDTESKSEMSAERCA